MTLDDSASAFADCESLVRSIEGIVWEANPENLQFTFVSEQAEPILGYACEEWLDENFWVDHLHPEDRDWAIVACRGAIEGGRQHKFEYRMIDANDREVWVQDTVFEDAGYAGPRRLRGLLVDISNRKRLEQ